MRYVSQRKEALKAIWICSGAMLSAKNLKRLWGSFKASAGCFFYQKAASASLEGPRLSSIDLKAAPLIAGSSFIPRDRLSDGSLRKAHSDWRWMQSQAAGARAKPGLMSLREFLEIRSGRIHGFHLLGGGRKTALTSAPSLQLLSFRVASKRDFCPFLENICDALSSCKGSHLTSF